MYEASGKLLGARMGLQALDQQACKQCSSDKGSTSCFMVQRENQSSYSYQALKVSLFLCPLPGLILGAWPWVAARLALCFPRSLCCPVLGHHLFWPMSGSHLKAAVPLPEDSPSASDTRCSVCFASTQFS